MYTMPHVYDFGFLFPHENQAGLPQLTFTISKVQVAAVYERVQALVHRAVPHAPVYAPHTGPFVPLTTEDLFGNKVFGYARTAVVTMNNGEVTIAILCRDRNTSRAAALTLHLLLMALQYCDRDEGVSNREQAILINTMAEDRSMGYGHAVTGSIDTSTLRYLHAVAPATGRAALPALVSDAIWTTWQHLAQNDTTSVVAGGVLDWHQEDCRATIAADARFLLECPGNACDIAIYPDGYSGSLEEGGALFSCHNLDAAHQQLALLAGLGMLCRLARAYNT